MRIEDKIWGERWMIREDSVHTTNILKLKKGFRCSWHRHKEKYNLFAVITGKVEIIIEAFWSEQGEIATKSFVLCGGESYYVEPGFWHEFRVIEDGIMVEEMYVEYKDEDIERAKLGGPIDE